MQRNTNPLKVTPANSGPGGEWKRGTWAGLTLPVVAWRVWFVDGTTADSTQNNWPMLITRAGVAMVAVYHPNGFRTRMQSCDAYPPPPGVTGPDLLGEWVGEVGDLRSREWRSLKEQIDADAAEWRP